MTDPTPSVSRIRALADDLETKRAAFPAATSWASEFRLAADMIAGNIDTLQRRLAEYRELEAMYVQQGLNMHATMQRAEAAEASLADTRRDAERLRGATNHSHLCKRCGLPYTPKHGESEDCPGCGFDGIDAAMGATHG